MERLTERIKRLQKDDLIVYTKGKYECAIPAEMTTDDIRAVLKKLAAYEDLEEQGLFVRLPCKVGDTFWVVTHPMNVDDSVYSDENLQIFESYVSSVTIYDDSRQYRIHDKKTRNPIIAYFQDRDLGEFIFLTREEAEKKLEEIKNDRIR